MDTYLITGGGGFIGSNLTKRLLKTNKTKIICVDNFLTGKRENIAEFMYNSNFQFINHNIIKPLKIKEKLDFVINLASPASPIDYRKHPIETLEAGSIGTKNLLEIARKNKARYIQASTSEVYGDPQEHPQKESYWGNVNSYGERSCYDEAKRYAEALIYYYRKDFGLNTGIIRIFNTYGPKMQLFDGRVISTLIRQALAGKDLTVFGDGSQTRSFCYIDDQVDAIVKMVDCNLSGPINIGNPAELTIRELAEKVLELTKSKSKIVYRKLPSDDPLRRQPDITLAKKELNWQPTVNLTLGLIKTIEWFRKQQN